MAQMRRIAKPMSRPKQRVTVEMLLYSATPLPGASRVSSCVKNLITTWGSGSLCLYVRSQGMFCPDQKGEANYKLLEKNCF